MPAQPPAAPVIVRQESLDRPPDARFQPARLGFDLDDLDRSPIPYQPIYLNDGGELFCVVDSPLYSLFVQYKWKPCWSKGSKRKCYGMRTPGRSKGFTTPHKAHWIHKLVCLHAYGLPPTPAHIIGDHMNGNSLDDRAGNLRWVTQTENNRNFNGVFARQLKMAFMNVELRRTLDAAASAEMVRLLLNPPKPPRQKGISRQ